MFLIMAKGRRRAITRGGNVIDLWGEKNGNNSKLFEKKSPSWRLSSHFISQGQLSYKNYLRA
jgi:hypothetical protein